MKSLPMWTGICALSLAGCASQPPQQQVISQAQSLPPVLIPLKAPCVLVTDIPSVPTTAKVAGQSTEQLAIASRIDENRWKEYGIRADTLLRSCVNPDGKETTK